MQGHGRRVAITGLGVVAPCGLGKEAFWNGLLGPGLDGVGRLTAIEEWDSSPYYESPKVARRADGVEQYAIAAAAEALAQSGELSVDPSRIGTIFGTGVGGIHTLEEQITVRIEKGERRVSPFLVPMMMANAPGAAVSMRHGFQGPCETIVTACAAGTHALTYAARLISWGLADAVVGGGSEHAGTVTALAGFGNMTALSTTGSSRPFDVDRDGFVMGEGAAAFVLEEWEVAVARGRHDHRRGARRSQHGRRPPHHRAVTRRCRRHQLHAPGARRRRPGTGRREADQRPRHVDPAQRCRRGRGDHRGVRCRLGSGRVHQGCHRSCARRRRCARGRSHGALVRARPHPADGEHQGARRRHADRRGHRPAA